MSKINILDKFISNRISAGEVVERPFSVVKELVENSIDANADKIVISVEEGGIKSISILDNGSGIEKDDIKLAFMPHATSKIKCVEDLDNISITDPDNYISSLNSDYWKVGHALYKDNNLEEYERLKKEISLVNINKEAIFKRISNDILEFSKHYALTLKTYLISYYEGIDNLEDLTIKDLLTKLGITDDVVISDIDIDSKKLVLDKRQ